RQRFQVRLLTGTLLLPPPPHHLVAGIFTPAPHTLPHPHPRPTTRHHRAPPHPRPTSTRTPPNRARQEADGEARTTRHHSPPTEPATSNSALPASTIRRHRARMTLIPLNASSTVPSDGRQTHIAA